MPEDYIKINKTVARVKFMLGKTLYLLPCKTGFYSIYVEAFELTKDDTDLDFDTFINNYEYYNCNSELGYYTSYYTIKDTQKLNM